MTFSPDARQQQMLLDLKPEQPPTLDNFVVGANVELIARLRGLGNTGSFESIYLWGDPGCGKSHLLAASAANAHKQRPVVLLPAAGGRGPSCRWRPAACWSSTTSSSSAPRHRSPCFAPSTQHASLASPCCWRGNQPPLRLGLREDLRTRIGQTLIYEIQSLSDEEKSAALRRHAIERGMLMDPRRGALPAAPRPAATCPR
jgi:DnaA family protein